VKGLPPAISRSIFRAQEALLGRGTFELLAQLEATQWRSRAEIEDLQRVKLNELLRTALAHCPWHARRIADAGLADRVRRGEATLSDLRLLPTMDKRDARENVDQMVWRGVPGGVFRYTTGGSSGEPLIFYFGRARQASDAAGRLRARRWWGVEPGDREVYLWGAPVELSRTDRIKTVRDRLVNQLLLNAFEMSPERMDAYIQAIREWRPRAIYGYASSLALLAARAAASGADLRIPGLCVVSTTGEPLYPHQRELIESTFGVPTSAEYGARDAGLIALESPDRVLLEMSETQIIEVLDEQGNAETEGEAVVTCLTSAAQPFIRYRTGDRVRRSARADPGRRGLHVMDAVVGRQTDFIVAADGRIMHALAVIYVLRAIAGISQFKVIQHAVDRVEVRLVPDSRWSEDARRAVVAGLRERLGAGVAVEVRPMDAIAPEASGKYRYVVSHVALDPSLQRVLA
jgi:phenylacetate-CoA ligase